MKKLLLHFIPLVLTMFFVQQSVIAQDCAIVSAEVSADTNCVFTTWADDFLSDYARSQIPSIKVNGVTFFRNDTTSTGLTVRYSRTIENDSLANCDTINSTGLFGDIVYRIFGVSDTCEFQGGAALEACPENVQVSQGGNCLVFSYLDSLYSAPPDSVTLNDSVYYSQGYDPNHPTEVIYLYDTTMACDTSNGMNVLLNDTLFFETQVCTYEDGILPIVILAFDYTVDADRVELSWKVNADEPTQRLYLQKSYDGARWTNVHDQAMTQPSTGLFTTGNFTDAAVDRSRVYYRLYIQGYQGKGNYSNVLPVTLADRKINQVYYQPQSRSIMIKAGKNFAGNMSLINTRGQNILSQEVLLSEGGYVEVQVEGALPAGIYFVRFDDELMPPAKLFIR